MPHANPGKPSKPRSKQGWEKLLWTGVTDKDSSEWRATHVLMLGGMSLKVMSVLALAYAKDGFQMFLLYDRDTWENFSFPTYAILEGDLVGLGYPHLRANEYHYPIEHTFKQTIWKILDMDQWEAYKKYHEIL